MNPCSLFRSFTRHVMLRRLVLALLPGLLAAAGLAILVWAASPRPAHADGPTFGEPRYFSTDVNHTNDVVMGDMDGDGSLDLVASNFNEPSTVYLNDGRGNFVISRTLGVNKAWNMALGDLDGNGNLDVVIGNKLQTGTIYLNDGDGGTALTRTFGTSSDEISAVALGDLDGDGDMDIAVGDDERQNKIYWNDGAAHFSATTNFGTGTDKTSGLAVGDMDGDGSLDLIVGNMDQPSAVYLNDGAIPTPTFAVSRSLGNDTTSDIVVGDVDGDGDLDVVAGNYYYRPSVVYLNDGAGRFGITRTLGTASHYAESIALGDLDGDGDLDVAAGNENEVGVVYSNDGNGNFILAGTFGPGSSNSGLALGDVNGDGHLDIAVGNHWQRNVVYLNDGAGEMEKTRLVGPYLPPMPALRLPSVAVGDMDGRNGLDVILGILNGQSAVYLNDGTGTFNWTGSDRKFSVALTGTSSVAVGDVDGDLDLDLVAGKLGGQSTVYLNEGSYFSTTHDFGGPTDMVLKVAMGDMDGDGDLDIVTGRLNQTGTVYSNNGGRFNWAGSSRELGAGSDNTQGLAVGDLDGDGDLDIAAGNYGTRNIVYLNDGSSHWPITRTFGTGSDKTTCLALADVDNNGSLDIITGNDDQQNAIYLNDGAANFDWSQSARYFGTGLELTYAVAAGDMDGDGDMDVIAGNINEPTAIYLNDGSGDFNWATPTVSAGEEQTMGVTVGDMDRDGLLDLVVANERQSKVYLNGLRVPARLPNNPPSIRITRPGQTHDAEHYSTPEVLEGLIPITYALSDPEGEPVESIRAFYSLDGGGRWQEAAAAASTITTNLSTGGRLSYYATYASKAIPDNSTLTSTLAVSELTGRVADLDAWVAITHPCGQDLDVSLRSPGGVTVELFSDVAGANFDHTVLSDQADTPITSGIAPFTSTYRPEGSLAALNGQSITGTWRLIIVDDTATCTGTLAEWGLRIKRSLASSHIFTWNPVASGFFGHSDNVVFRIEAYPGQSPSKNTPAGPYQWPYVAATTFPFRVRGTQVRVMSDTVPAANALVYRLPKGERDGGALISDDAGVPFHTDAQGYLQGRGELSIGDKLLALAPITWTDTYTLYYTNGTPEEAGVIAHTVSAAGVQTLTVSAGHPLLIFDLAVSLEWDAHSDTSYLDELAYNLQRASEHLYDFTNGQVALGRIDVYQNADEWAYGNVAVRANNRLRPFAAQGGIVLTDTVDPQHPAIVYAPGQVTMGAIWNRYGNPGQSLGEDWAIILAHELSHYLLYHDDTYLGLDEDGYLKAVTTCVGSAMGDLYDKPVNTEFIADEGHWQARCADTLAEKTLGRNEWETIRTWYPALVTATALASPTIGPTSMPFDLTDVVLHDPYTPTQPLLDPTFYVEYADGASGGGAAASTEARAYLLRGEGEQEYTVNLGSPYGGQNRLVAYGAQPGDRLCVFDRPHAQYGCENVAFGDDRLALERDINWDPIILLTPVNSTTLTLSVTNPASIASPLLARLYPEFGYGGRPVTLTQVGPTYTGTFTTTYPALVGDVQVWVVETATETNPRRETMVAYSVGGNPGAVRGGGGAVRGGGGAVRGGGGAVRGGGGAVRGGGAPIVSPDGQMILFIDNPASFVTGTLFIVQAMAGLPELPPGRTVIGQGYSLAASPGASLPLTTSVSIQYLSNDVQVAGADESDLALYHWDGSAWIELDTALDTYYNLASAPLPRPGPGIYALMASVKIGLFGPGWNTFAYPLYTAQPVSQALLSISGYYTTVYGYEAQDELDPWKVYDVNVPGQFQEAVNDLEVIEFGKGYWINVTQGITLYLGSSARLAEVALPPGLPSTYYGVVAASAGFTPTAGMTVAAKVDTAWCGWGKTSLVDEEVVYVIDVLADGLDAPGCGAAGRQVKFWVGGLPTQPSATWSEGLVTQLALGYDPTAVSLRQWWTAGSSRPWIALALGMVLAGACLGAWRVRPHKSK